ncbi:putative transporter [Escovopsis weberi]|uniref:Putative transporter n=1 Tax=Escovopsis weberi TaxID=150374 RepID=A0A0M8N4U4_ESCWE|nr:putative transporter [Escovopsis weberi]
MVSHAKGTEAPAAQCRGESASVSADEVIETTVVHVVDHAAERRLCLKFDIRILPALALIYLFNALDKGNLANAQTQGLSEGTPPIYPPHSYNLIVSVFFVPYVLFSPPMAMLGKRIGPSRMLPLMILVCGFMTLCTAAASSFSAIFATRWFLGMAESAFFPVVIYYLTTIYRRGELARRLAIFYAAFNLANAFSGLLAFAVFHIKSSRLSPWRYLFIVEGSATVVASAFAYWYLPPSADRAAFLSPEEKALARHRIEVDSSSVVAERLDLRDALKIFGFPTTYGFLLIEICLGVPLQSVALFLPQIIQRLGYPAIKTNLFTVAPNVTGAAVLLVLAFCSDHTGLRFPFIALGFALTFTGFIVYAALRDVMHDIHLAYFATFMMCWGTSAPSVLLSTWYNNNTAHEGRRILLTSVGVPLANLMGLVSSNIFRQEDAPKYAPAIITTACFGAVGVLTTLLMGLYMMLDNKRRDRKAGVRISARDVPTARLRDGPKSPDFRWIL